MLNSSNPARRWLAVSVSVVASFSIGFAVAALVRDGRTSTRLQVVTARKVSNVPLGCRRAIAVTRQLKGLTDVTRLPELQDEFHAAADACRIPNACHEAFTHASRLFSEIQENRPDALAVYRAFQAAARGCR